MNARRKRKENSSAWQWCARSSHKICQFSWSCKVFGLNGARVGGCSLLGAPPYWDARGEHWGCVEIELPVGGMPQCWGIAMRRFSRREKPLA